MTTPRTPIVRDRERRFRVLVALRLYETAGQNKLAGIFSHLDATSDWDLALLRTQDELTAAALDEAVDAGLDGLIVSLAEDAQLFSRIAALKCPVIVLDSDPGELKARRHSTGVIRNDAEEIVRTALAAFSSCGRFNSIAYVGSRLHTDWSQKRALAFRRLAGRHAHVLSPPQNADGRRAIVRFLQRLKLPAAVLAAHDQRAADVIAAAEEAGIEVPRELSVLGIDNDPYVCNRTHPAIASIEPDFFGEGRAAARLLDKMMRSRRPLSNRHVAIGVKRLVQRGSLIRLPPAQSLLERAHAFIRNHATEGIAPSDVAAHLGVSRQLLDLRFREAKRGSVCAFITEAKLSKVKQLLSGTDAPIAQLAALCGFANDNALKNLFKRSVGRSMRDYRRFSRLQA